MEGSMNKTPFSPILWVRENIPLLSPRAPGWQTRQLIAPSNPFGKFISLLLAMGFHSSVYLFFFFKIHRSKKSETFHKLIKPEIRESWNDGNSSNLYTVCPNIPPPVEDHWRVVFVNSQASYKFINDKAQCMCFHFS